MLKIFEGKTPNERNKIIAALVLGTMATLALFNTFVGFSPARKTTVTVSSASPSPTVSPKPILEPISMPNQADINIDYMTTPIVYNPGNFYAPDAGRNIFAFYEPPPPTPIPPYAAPPVVFKTPLTPVPPMPAATPPIFVSFVSPQSVYAGSKTFRLEVNGDKFTPDSVIVFNGNQLPTTYLSPQKLVADVPSNFISSETAAQISVVTPGGLFSNAFVLNVQAPPQPQFQYVGMIARKRANNDTAYFQEQGKPAPFGARLNDVVAGRFRIASISSSEVVLEDVSLGFRHRLALYRPAPGQATGGYNPYNPNLPSGYGIPVQSGEIPGIPNNLPRPGPPPPLPTPADDDDGDN